MNGARVNGWDMWFYKDEDGGLQPLDNLRSKLRDLTKQIAS